MSFDGLSVLTDALSWLVSARDFGWILAMLLSPLCMTVLAGLIFEHRMVRLVDGQSLSFCPGETILILTVVATSVIWQ